MLMTLHDGIKKTDKSHATHSFINPSLHHPNHRIGIKLRLVIRSAGSDLGYVKQGENCEYIMNDQLETFKFSADREMNKYRPHIFSLKCDL